MDSPSHRFEEKKKNTFFFFSLSRRMAPGDDSRQVETHPLRNKPNGLLATRREGKRGKGGRVGFWFWFFLFFFFSFLSFFANLQS